MTKLYISRRSMLRSALFAGACALIPENLPGLDVAPRYRVILDNDFSGDPDGLFQAAHHLASPSVEVPLIIGSHIHPKDFLDSSSRQADNAASKVGELCASMGLQRIPRIVAGRNTALAAGDISNSESTARIIEEALREDTGLPLFYAAGAGLTELAAALRLEPRIAHRLTLVWIGGMEYPDLRPGVPHRTDPEYNTTIDIPAVQEVFRTGSLSIWQVPRDTYRTMLVSQAELDAWLGRAGRLGDFLSAQLQRVQGMAGNRLGETYILGDSPLVTLTALQSSFEPDSSSSRYVERPRPEIADDGSYGNTQNSGCLRVYTAIDTRLTFTDMFDKFVNVGNRRNRV